MPCSQGVRARLSEAGISSPKLKMGGLEGVSKTLDKTEMDVRLTSACLFSCGASLLDCLICMKPNHFYLLRYGFSDFDFSLC